MSVSTSSKDVEAEGAEQLGDGERIKRVLEKTTGFRLELEEGSVLRSRGYQSVGNQIFDDGELI